MTKPAIERMPELWELTGDTRALAVFERARAIARKAARDEPDEIGTITVLAFLESGGAADFDVDGFALRAHEGRPPVHRRRGDHAAYDAAMMRLAAPEPPTALESLAAYEIGIMIGARRVVARMREVTGVMPSATRAIVDYVLAEFDCDFPGRK